MRKGTIIRENSKKKRPFSFKKQVYFNVFNVFTHKPYLFYCTFLVSVQGQIFVNNLCVRIIIFLLLRLVKRATNLFNNRTLAIHPASTTFGFFTP